jgi:hypothetical protein
LPEFVDGFGDVIDTSELLVLARVADIGNLIEFTQCPRDPSANLVARDLPIELSMELVFNSLDQRDLGVLGNRSFSAGRLNAAKNAFAVERHPGVIPFHHDQAPRLFDAFEGGESFFAVFTFPTAADRRATFPRP